MTQSKLKKKLRDRLEEKLAPLSPSRLVVHDESDRHIGHAGHNGAGESHFALEITSAAFIGLSRLQRQRRVMDLIAPLWAETGLHALSMRTFAPDESPVD
ncbi:MAG: BolA family transcriptional regulator [Rhodospirillales bacterium]|nr:BolA family transcriptional regulator [Alphaproteobacteria bacterium]MCB9986096.1 BolA family transcriptional regulator [Rhodospirillales bacterium]USO07342.1 MAG: BolA family transcriptional regulator [Rhodospirillales bacterium]